MRMTTHVPIWRERTLNQSTLHLNQVTLRARHHKHYEPVIGTRIFGKLVEVFQMFLGKILLRTVKKIATQQQIRLSPSQPCLHRTQTLGWKAHKNHLHQVHPLSPYILSRKSLWELKCHDYLLPTTCWIQDQARDRETVLFRGYFIKSSAHRLRIPAKRRTREVSIVINWCHHI